MKKETNKQTKNNILIWMHKQNVMVLIKIFYTRKTCCSDTFMKVYIYAVEKPAAKFMIFIISDFKIRY